MICFIKRFLYNNISDLIYRIENVLRYNTVLLYELLF